jgi:mRNA-degrading endonuclease toxin of MazEF toxin-antitoxin module
MPFPEPQRGLVISYSYLWHHEHCAGQDEGRKNRPCVIVVAIESSADGTTMVRVVPVTHTPPNDAGFALELPAAVKRHLGLDDERSWVILDEVNEFAWPGFDLRPVPGAGDRFAYGFVPPHLFDQLMGKLRQVWSAGRGKATPRD